MCTFYGYSIPGGWLTSALILLGAAAVVLLVRTLCPPGRPDFRRGAAADRDDALRILRRRLAEGDISVDEFDRLRRAVDPLATDGNR